MTHIIIDRDSRIINSYEKSTKTDVSYCVLKIENISHQFLHFYTL